MKKRFTLRLLAILLAVCLTAAYCPAALALDTAVNFNVWVNGVRVTSANASSLMGGRAKFVYATRTLTLNGASLTKGTPVYDSDVTAAIYSTGTLNIVLQGKNTITNSNGFGIATDDALTISGSGSLTVNSTGNMCSSIYSGEALTVSTCSITATASGEECNAVYAAGVTLDKNAALNLTAKGSSAITLCSENDVKIASASVSATAAGDASNGMYISGKLTLSGTASASATASGDECFGIVADSDIYINSGRVAADTSGVCTTGISVDKLSIVSGSVTSFGTEAALFAAGAPVLGSGSTFIRSEGAAVPGSTVSSFTNTYGSSGFFQSKPYIQATDKAEVIRLGGSSRVDTAALISDYGWDIAENVVLANAYSYADALAGVPLAYALNAPVMLISGTTVDDAVLAQMADLKTKNVYLLGGTGVISADAEQSLATSGYSVTRVFGDNRSGTAVAIAKKLAEITGKSPSTVFFAYGYNYPDALAISSVAAIKGSPVLYAPATGTLDAITADYIKTLSAGSAVILGGDGAVGSDVLTDIQTIIPTVERVSGDTRYDTAAAIIKKYSSVFTGSGIAVATGTNYPDALAGAALAARKGVAVMLVPASLTAGSSQTTSLRALVKSSPVYVFGGDGAVSEAVLTQLIN